MRTLIAAGALALLVSTPAFASHCPADAAAITAALEKVTISDELKAQVIALRDEGIQLHEAGNHAEAEGTLANAMRQLLQGL